MSEPREPGRPEDPGISLPSWVDAAIAKSRDHGDPGERDDEARADEADDASALGPAAEISVNPPASPPASESETAWPTDLPMDPEGQNPVVVARSPRDARRRAVLPWVALALLFAGAAMVIGYILLTRPSQP